MSADGVNFLAAFNAMRFAVRVLAFLQGRGCQLVRQCHFGLSGFAI
ncbi:hypothetical protein VHA_000294 [Grimontia hollisae CIP 101886]|uniref:Uncharacterized protein n=1 Tax=Grimontia hollisae CIP 101886 TaxID=675812 RepID=D0I3I1_GRIHO|nr:hypothetical protein VHA_000294 [Grimontia hollisae CIP 101886]